MITFKTDPLQCYAITRTLTLEYYNLFCKRGISIENAKHKIDSYLHSYVKSEIITKQQNIMILEEIFGVGE